MAVKVEMTTRFRNPVKTCSQVTVSARIIRASQPLYLLEAEIARDGENKATITDKFYDRPDLVYVFGQFS